MNARYFFKCVGVGLLIGVVLVLALANMAAGTEATEVVTPVPGIELMISASHPNGLDLAWTDPSGGYRGGYRLLHDTGGVTIDVFKVFAPGSRAGSVSGLACGATYRFWLVSGDGRDSNTIVGVTGPCE